MANRYAESVFNFVDETNDALTIGDLNRSFRRLVDAWGFDNWMCIEISKKPTTIVHPLNQFFGEANKDWIERYREAHHIHNDLAAHEIIRTRQAFWWSDFRALRAFRKPHQLVYEEAADFGMEEGLAIPVRFPDGSVWSCCLTGERVEKSQEVLDAASVAAQFYAGRGGFLREKAKPNRLELSFRLTKRQREVVELLRYGKTQAEIAEILAISMSTVFNTLAEARQRLGVATAAELVAEALLNGEIAGMHDLRDSTITA